MYKSKASILDFPRKRLSESLWVYDDPDDLPTFSPGLRQLILNTVNKQLHRYNLTPWQTMLHGGSATYQWSEGTDIDVSIYAKGWPEDITAEEIEWIQNQFREVKEEFQGYPIQFFLNPPTDKIIEVSDAVYDIANNEWILPPLVLPQGFDPDIYFAPFMKASELKAKKFDEKIGKLRRAWKILEKASKAKEEAREPELVENRIALQKEKIKIIVKDLVETFMAVREKRYAMHEKLEEKMRKDTKLGRFERFQEPEIVWKYLDRAGYNKFLWKLHKIEEAGTIDNILAKF